MGWHVGTIAVGSETTCSTDAFNRTNATSLGTADTGETWTTWFEPSNTTPGAPVPYFGIVSNKAYNGQSSGASSNPMAALIDIGVTDYTIRVTVDWNDHSAAHLSGRPDLGLVARHNTSNAESIIITQGGVTKVSTTGTGTPIFAVGGVGIFDYGDEMMAVFAGRYLDLYKNGTLYQAAVDMGPLGIPSGTNVGLYSTHAESLVAASYPLWDGFSVCTAGGGWS